MSNVLLVDVFASIFDGDGATQLEYLLEVRGQIGKKRLGE